MSQYSCQVQRLDKGDLPCELNIVNLEAVFFPQRGEVIVSLVSGVCRQLGVRCVSLGWRKVCVLSDCQSHEAAAGKEPSLGYHCFIQLSTISLVL